MRILNVKEDAVTRGVLDKNVEHVRDVQEVTFMDNVGVPHTVYVHKDGPFTDPHDAAAAWDDGSIHDEPGEPAESLEGKPPQGEAFE